MQKRGALDGIRVLDLSRLLPGPYCTMILADHGARVICVEDRRFETAGHYVTTVNRNKEHITLNLKTFEGQEVFTRLAAVSDVIVEGFRPGVVTKLGVDYAAVRKLKKDIIYCSISGFGQNGPYRDRAGHDVNYLSLSGVLDLMGEKNRPPAIPGVQISDMVAGMNAAIGILLALLERGKTGQGQYIDVAMTDSAIAFLPVVQVMKELLGADPLRGDGYLSHRYACYNIYTTADNRHIAIGAVEPHFWQNLCRHFSLEEYIPLQYEDARREEIIVRLREIFQSKNLEEWCRELRDVEACWSPVCRYSEVLADPHVQAREMVTVPTVDGGQGGSVLGVPVKLSRTPGGVCTPAPAFGENTRAVLVDLGYSDDEIKTLHRKGAV
jgi:crotonobetainyl-CoA:carnitine CoA-transferase CaiB-like acyl-CoA transferase